MSAPIEAAIATRYTSPEHALFFEVSDAAGFGASRRADAVAMSLWPSRGLLVHGFEIKESRADWLRELRNPAKSAPVQKYCDRWWVVVSDGAIVVDGELPKTWGLLVLQGKKLVQKVEAPALQPVPLDRSFVACLLRAATSNTVPKSALHELVSVRVQETVERRRSFDAVHSKRMDEEVAKLTKCIEDFEAASGVKIETWGGNPVRIGAAVRFLLNEGAAHEEMLSVTRTRLAHLLGEVDASIAELRALDAKRPKKASTG